MAYQRKTRDVWSMMSNYGYGWECELEEASWGEMRDQLKVYRENCPGADFKAVKRRDRIEQVQS